ncbi:peptidoglycan-associated lipoprotein Pal [Sutterella sp.]|uniref:peptidoglycan-associated lipoprotein Pal n=1 Tax=Sutterella sp. TaxID=1981025 RepID=UPI0026E0E580|nr:peptidoglycan-associated lipoprotein Pal [Sutterella sp.]MDO5531013.1 peptidoglycan-associated lipoprotein Pal [Sutterella sp.]
MTISWKALAAAAAVAALLSGCSSVSLDEGALEGTLAGEQKAAAVNPFEDPSNPLSRRSVYFDFDSYDVSPEYAAIVEAHAKWLGDHPQVNIVVQGHTDERGGREYNLALGQKRSEAVRQRMQLLGVSGDRVEAVSFGKEKPFAEGHTEEAWAQNRRADIVYPANYGETVPQPASAAR